MSIEAELVWKEGIQFESHIRQHNQIVDGKKEFGGKDMGPNPKELVMAGLCGCTGMDVASLLKKFRASFESLKVSGRADATTDHPIRFKSIELLFSLTGPELDPKHAEKAVSMSMTKYCGVSAMLSKAAPIHYTIEINGEKTGSGEARFEI